MSCSLYPLQNEITNHSSNTIFEKLIILSLQSYQFRAFFSKYLNKLKKIVALGQTNTWDTALQEKQDYLGSFKVVNIKILTLVISQ